MDENGDVVSHDDYYPFGLQMPFRSFNIGTDTDIYKYNGKELDDEAGINWHYYGARYYDAEIGRWHAVDPMADDYVAWSSYNYALNNPIKLNDPDGRSPDISILGSWISQISAGYSQGKSGSQNNNSGTKLSATIAISSGASKVNPMLGAAVAGISTMVLGSEALQAFGAMLAEGSQVFSNYDDIPLGALVDPIPVTDENGKIIGWRVIGEPEVRGGAINDLANKDEFVEEEKKEDSEQEDNEKKEDDKDDKENEDGGK